MYLVHMIYWSNFMDRMLKIIFILLTTTFTGLSAGEWKTSAFLNVPRAGASAVTWDGKIYVFGGKSTNNIVLNSVEVFDPSTGLWDSTIVEPFEKARYNASAIVLKNKIYLIGGRKNDDVTGNVEIYDLVQNTWEEAQDLHKEREGHSVHFFNDRVYTIGGQKDSYNLIAEIEWYDSNEEKWQDANFELPYQRAAHFAEVYNNEYLMFGGYYYGLTNTIYKATPGTEGYSWVELDTLAEPRAYGATVRIDSLIYIIGGETASGKTKRVEIFNVKNSTLSQGEDMTMAHSGMATAVLDGKIYVIGGFEGIENDVVDHVHLYTPTVTAIHDKLVLRPSQYLLAKVYPNPFNGRVKIDIKFPLSEMVQIDILNVLGQKIRLLENRRVISGKYSFFWDAKDDYERYVSSGIYFVSVRTQTQYQILKITYVK